MKRFKYRAESYLKFLSHLRDDRLKIYKDAQAFKQKLVDRYSWMENEMKKAYKENEKVGQLHRSIAYVNDNNQFISMLKNQMGHLSQEISLADEEIARAFHELQKLQLQVKKIELHKEQEEVKFKKERNKKLQKQFDELNATKHRGRNAESI